VGTYGIGTNYDFGNDEMEENRKEGKRSAFEKKGINVRLGKRKPFIASERGGGGKRRGGGEFVVLHEDRSPKQVKERPK